MGTPSNVVRALSKLNDASELFKPIKFAKDLDLNRPYLVERLEEFLDGKPNDANKSKLLLHLREVLDSVSEDCLYPPGEEKFKLFLSPTFTSFEKREAFRFLINNRETNKLVMLVKEIKQLAQSECPIYAFQTEKKSSGKALNELQLLNNPTNFIEIRSFSLLTEKMR